MDKRITFGDLKNVVKTLQDNWGADDDVIVIYDQNVADVLQQLLDDMSDREKYLDWVNNFLTVARFAEYYGMTEKQANALIERERAK